MADAGDLHSEHLERNLQVNGVKVGETLPIGVATPSEATLNV